MKTIKIILGVIIALAVIFLATGLIFKETSYTTEVKINKPLDEVFTLFNDTSEITNWIPEVKSFEPIEVKSGKIGSTYKMVVNNNNGEEIILKEKILAYVPNEKVTLFFNGGSMLKTDDIVFTHNNGVTTITNNSVCEGGSYLLSCVFPFFKSVFVKQDQGYLNNFKTYIENKE